MKTQKRITLIQPAYPYRKKQTYLGGSILNVASQLDAIGYEVRIIDLNLQVRLMPHEDFNQYFGITVLGAPYLPSAIQEAKWLHGFAGNKTLVGGQGIESLTDKQFKDLFGETAIQIKNEGDMLKALREKGVALPPAHTVSIQNVLSQMQPALFKHYLSHEMTMFLSQGCHFKCAFCAAKKARMEQFKSIEVFDQDMRYLAESAKKFGIPELQFYATSLDFFQNPKTIFKYLEYLAKIQKESGVKFKIRCLTCMTSFINAVNQLGEKNFGRLMKESGLYSVGFGVDGADTKVWKAQKKNQNKMSDIKDCLDLAQSTGIQSEILMIMGFPQDTFKTLLKCFIDSIRYIKHWPNTMLRPYLAKEFVPGNDNWELGGPMTDIFISNPKKFYNLDFCAIGSKTTHPKFWHRMWSNTSYLAIIIILLPFGRCLTYPLFPQGDDGWYGRFAKWFNKIVPFDR